MENKDISIKILALEYRNTLLLKALKALFNVVIEREQGNNDLKEELDLAELAIEQAEKTL